MAIPYSYQELEHIYAKSIGKGARSIAVTASKPQEGTSSVVCSLARRAKAVGFKVLVVDSNLNNPSVTNSITTMLEGENQQNLNSINDYWIDDSQTTKPLRLTDLDGLSDSSNHNVNINVIPAPIKQSTERNPQQSTEQNTEHLRIREQSHLQALINLWHQQHDIIIFDTSPLCLINKNNIPPQTIASCCDGALLVVQTGTTNANELQDAMNILHSQKINLLGTVMNENKTPLLSQELARQCEKLEQLLPKLGRMLKSFVSNNPFLQRQF